MSHDILPVPWRVAGASVRGALHTRASLPNQDALGWIAGDGAGGLLVALSDGHGSAKSFRSDTGARLAVDTALAIVPPLLSGDQALDAAALSAQLPQALVEAWRTAVAQHLAGAPFGAEEWARLSAQEGPAACAAVEDNPWLAYGATLLIAAVTAEDILYAQLGDGDVLVVPAAGAVLRPRWPADARLFANATTSLCMAEAWREMRVDVQPLSEMSPALIVLASDGYANSFASDAGFLQVGSDLLELIHADGLDAVAAALPGWLADASRLGSGDDISVGLLFRPPGACNPLPDAPAVRLDGEPQVSAGVEAPA